MFPCSTFIIGLEGTIKRVDVVAAEFFLFVARPFGEMFVPVVNTTINAVFDVVHDCVAVVVVGLMGRRRRFGG